MNTMVCQARLIEAAPELFEALKNIIKDSKQKLSKQERIERLKFQKRIISKIEN